MTNWFEIRVPKSTDWQPQVAATFMQALVKQIKAWMDMQVVCTHERISFVVFSPDENALSFPNMQSLVAAYYPEAEVIAPDGWGLEYPYFRRFHVFAKNETNFYETLTSVYQHKHLDPLALATQTMEQLEPGEILTYHVHIWGIQRFSEEEIFDLLTISAYDRGDRYTSQNFYRKDLFEAIGEMAALHFQNKRLQKEKVWRHEEKDIERYVGKLNQALAEVSVYIRLDTPKQERLELLSTISTAIKNTADQGIGKLIDGVERSGKIATEDRDNNLWPVHTIIEWLDAADEEQAQKISQRDLIAHLTADELASLWHLPHKGFTNTKIQWIDESVKPMPEALKQANEGVKLGLNGEYPVYLPTEERTEHTVIVGKTGTGKSTLMEQMIISDIAQGRGVVVIDRHGELVRSVLRSGIPTEREEDLVLLDFGNFTNPPPLNPLYRPAQVESDIAADMLMAVMTKIYRELAGKEMGDTLHTALLTIAAADNPTILDVIRLFDDPVFRNSLLERVDDFTVHAFWNRFDGYTAARQDELIRPVLRRLNAFYRNRHLRAIVCHPEPLKIRQMVADNKIILVSLSADEAKMPGEQQELLGAMLVAQIQMAAMDKAITNPPFMLYIDEAQYYVTTALPKMLDESRKQGLGIVLANQYLHQLVGETLKAVKAISVQPLLLKWANPMPERFCHTSNRVSRSMIW